MAIKKTTRNPLPKKTPTPPPPAASRKLTPMPPQAPMIVRSAPVLRPAPTCEQIARRAYELFATRGYQHGNDVQDWLSAENELWARR